jgi:HlyD family secretion protein
MFHKVGFWLILAITLIAAGSGYVYYNKTIESAQTTAEPAVQTAVVRRGNLVISASGTGSVIPSAQISIGFEESGILTDLLVSVGDQVQEGDVLARLQTQNTAESIAVTISDAELSVLNYQQALDNLINQDNSLALAQAQVDVILAQQNLTTTLDIRQRLNYQRCLNSTIESYEAQYYLALNEYNVLNENYQENFASLPDSNPSRLNALATLLAAEDNTQMALANLNWCIGTATDAEITHADANVTLAEALVQAAGTEVERLLNYPDPYAVALAEAQLAAAQSKLTLAEEIQSTLELVAPMDGTVLSVLAIKGESIGASAIITIANLELPMLEVYLEETDMNNIGIGYDVEVVFDALPNQTFTGHILRIDPSLTSVENVTAMRALVQLDAESFAKPQTLPNGLNASVEVINGKAEDVLLVPVEALRELSPGSYSVFVSENNQLNLHIVEVGIMDFTYAEVISGLDEGDVVTTGIVETSQ